MSHDRLNRPLGPAHAMANHAAPPDAEPGQELGANGRPAADGVPQGATASSKHTGSATAAAQPAPELVLPL